MELHSFIKENMEFISAETELNKIIRAAESGEKTENDTAQITNLLKMIGESANDI